MQTVKQLGLIISSNSPISNSCKGKDNSKNHHKKTYKNIIILQLSYNPLIFNVLYHFSWLKKESIAILSIQFPKQTKNIFSLISLKIFVSLHSISLFLCSLLILIEKRDNSPTNYYL